MKAWPAPAKLNLFLHIVGRRADGYHLLQTVFQFLDWGDELTFAARDDGAVRRANDVAGIPADDDLAVRAARALQARTACRLGCDIRTVKRIPLGGGLGGGSSNAATALVVLNRLWRTGLDDDALAELGLTLGADVPVFVRGASAWAEGVGEQLSACSPPERWYLVATPPCTVDTRAMYAAPELPRAHKLVTEAEFKAGRTGNDFEAVVRRAHPPVAAALDWAARFGRARLSGSGASVFVDFADRDAAEQARAQAPASLACVVARGLNESPLRRALVS